ncbi:hypothetical protein H6503_05510 [Candidatus Woesearchaeota archaeon]|nr:hypothetical protein [Candidatus Woesearchaeota archaeon]
MSQKLKQDKKTSKGIGPDQETLKEEMDYWVKDFEKKISRTNDIQTAVDENKQNIDYNYELIKGLQKEIADIKKDMAQMKHYNFIAMKSRPLRDLSEQ